jgi:hypothetical protein
MRRILPAVLLALIPAAAMAGYKSNYPVAVNPTARYAYGDAAATRNSADGTSWLYCTVSGAAIAQLWCGARDSAGHYGSCVSNSAALITAATSANGDSYFWFSWDANGNCTQLEIDNGSPYQPKQP